MRKIAVLSLILAGLLGDSVAAPAQRRGRTAGASAPAASASAQPATAARAATGARTAPRTAGGTSAAAKPVSARSATPTSKPVVAARAGATQKVIGSGTKVAAAAKNVVVSEECQAKYDGCMDAFCMLDNETGGRCLCSDRNAELDAILAEIEKLDQQSYQMATVGVERIEMGADADAAMAAANAVADSLTTAGEEKKARKALDLSMWDAPVDFEDEDVWGEAATSSIDGKEGDALHSAAASLCAEQIPECKSELNMLKMMYAQRIKSDCAAYENSLKQQKSASANKLAVAQKAMREAALDQLRTANKYDLGQCTVEFKKCMQTTGGCGTDFSGCASISAMDNTNTKKSTRGKAKTYKIQGSVTEIEISASTYDALIAKKPLCESVTKSCVAVADQVWDTFLKEVAPQVKSAELIAEDNARQDCIGNISSCFQKACKDSMDPNDPDGSYDMCLSRPGTMLNVCKIPLNACGIDASSESNAAKSNIWDFVVARLASMRVDSCTTEVKECLQSEDRCGEDYSQCIGLDTDTIIRMCPYDKLTGCQKVYGDQDIRGDNVYDELATMVQGIMINIDNNLLTQCQNAANTAMVNVCGDTENCTGLTIDENIGSRSLEYKICEYTNSEAGLDINYSKCRTDVSQIMDTELGKINSSASTDIAQVMSESGLGPITPFAGVLDGTIYWESVGIGEDGRLDIESYWETVDAEGNIKPADREKINSELAVLQRNIDAAINTIEADPTVQYCMTGRQVQGMKEMKIGRGQSAARFPELTKQMRMSIANAALKTAKDNYYKKYDELNAKMLQDYATIGERMAEIQGENALDARRELARYACVNFAEMGAMAKSPEPPKNAFGKILAAVAIAGAAVAIPFTAPLGMAVGATAMVATGIAATAGVASAGVGIAAIGLAGNAGSKSANGADGGGQTQLSGSKQLNQWNYKETVTSTFNWETLQCQKCVRSQQCSKTKNPLFGSKYCKTWADPVESCSDTQF